MRRVLLSVLLYFLPAVVAHAMYFDAETGLIYNHNRYYDPTLGRYLQSDPKSIREHVKEAQVRQRVSTAVWRSPELNTYRYALDNPLRYTDPTGLGPVTAGVCTAFVGGFSAGQRLSSLEQTAEAERSLRSLLDQATRVNAEISKCPLEDTNRLQQLDMMRRDLAQKISVASKQVAEINNGVFGLSDIAEDLIMEGICGLTLFAPTP